MPATAVTKPAKAGRQKMARKLQGARSTRAPSPSGTPPELPARPARSTRQPALSRQTQAERRKKAEQAILAAALQIIADRGLDELTLAEAGELAGYSRALPAHYFESRDAALVALCNFVVEKYLRRVQRHVPGREGLEGFLDRLVHYFDDGRKDPRVLRAFHAFLALRRASPSLRSPSPDWRKRARQASPYTCAQVSRAVKSAPISCRKWRLSGSSLRCAG
jgi:AcrR family transcriptional regulator